MTEQSSSAQEAVRSAEEAHRATQIASDATERAQDAVERAVREGSVPGTGQFADPTLEGPSEYPPPAPMPGGADREAFRGADHLGEHGVDEGRL